MKQLPTLLTGIISNHHSCFHYLLLIIILIIYYLHTFRAENKIKSHKNVCDNNNFCNIVMPTKDNKTLELNQYYKSEFMQMFNRNN